MKTTMIALAAALLATGASAGTVTRTGEHGTSVTQRSHADGTFTASGTWSGTEGGTYTRQTVCTQGRCETVWTLDDRKGRMSSGERNTVWGDGKSTTRASVTGPRGETRERTIERTRSVTR
jgi:hypothetical protein